MDNWTVFLIIAVVLGVIASNVMLLKHSAKFKFPSEFKSKSKDLKPKPQDEKAQHK